jgi:hypothetical protein
VRAQKLEYRVQFIERQLQEKIPAFLAAADVLLVHLKKSELSHYVIPTKTLAYLAAGRPILMAMDGAAAHLIRERGQASSFLLKIPARWPGLFSLFELCHR